MEVKVRCLTWWVEMAMSQGQQSSCNERGTSCASAEFSGHALQEGFMTGLRHDQYGCRHPRHKPSNQVEPTNQPTNQPTDMLPVTGTTTLMKFSKVWEWEWETDTLDTLVFIHSQHYQQTRYVSDGLCFTICLFISPDLDGTEVSRYVYGEFAYVSRYT